MRVLHEDAHVLVVVKPAGTSTQAPPIAGPTLEDDVRRHLNPTNPAVPYLGTVHRLDRPVSGVVIWAKTPRDARRLARQFEKRQARKEYWAVVQATPPIPPEALWEDWLLFDASTGLKRSQVCRPGTPRAQFARATARHEPGATLPPGLAWLRLWPETGRTHQLRAQAAAHLGPIVGDALYGATDSFPNGIALHARALTVRHPALDQLMTFTAPVPDAWREAGFHEP